MLRSAVFVFVTTAACSFQGAPMGGGSIDASEGSNDADPGVDAAPVVCAGGTLECDPNAMCVDTPELHCECNPGFSGDGMTCTDVNECSTANGGCPARCLNQPGTHECYVPVTCEDIRAKEPGFTGDASLYDAANPSRPWPAFCDGDAEYLNLPANNFSQYTQGGDSLGTNVRTTYQRVRIEPVELKVDIADQKYSTSTGMLTHDGGTAVTSMPYAVAMDCRGNNSQMGVAKIVLTGTNLVLDNPTFTNFGNMQAGNSTASGGGSVLDLTGGGRCGWRAPTGTPFDPFNQIAPSYLIDLEYGP